MNLPDKRDRWCFRHCNHAHIILLASCFPHHRRCSLSAELCRWSPAHPHCESLRRQSSPRLGAYWFTMTAAVPFSMARANLQGMTALLLPADSSCVSRASSACGVGLFLGVYFLQPTIDNQALMTTPQSLLTRLSAVFLVLCAFQSNSMALCVFSWLLATELG